MSKVNVLFIGPCDDLPGGNKLNLVLSKKPNDPRPQVVRQTFVHPLTCGLAVGEEHGLRDNAQSTRIPPMIGIARFPRDKTFLHGRITVAQDSHNHVCKELSCDTRSLVFLLGKIVTYLHDRNFRLIGQAQHHKLPVHIPAKMSRQVNEQVRKRAQEE